MPRHKRELVDLEAVLVHQTEKAYLLDFDGEDAIWIPKSIAEVYDEPTSSGLVTVTLPISYATDKGLV